MIKNWNPSWHTTYHTLSKDLMNAVIDSREKKHLKEVINIQKKDIKKLLKEKEELEALWEKHKSIEVLVTDWYQYELEFPELNYLLSKHKSTNGIQLQEFADDLAKRYATKKQVMHLNEEASEYVDQIVKFRTNKYRNEYGKLLAEKEADFKREIRKLKLAYEEEIEKQRLIILEKAAEVILQQANKLDSICNKLREKLNNITFWRFDSKVKAAIDVVDMAEIVNKEDVAILQTSLRANAGGVL